MNIELVAFLAIVVVSTLYVYCHLVSKLAWKSNGFLRRCETSFKACLLAVSLSVLALYMGVNDYIYYLSILLIQLTGVIALSRHKSRLMQSLQTNVLVA